MGLSFQLVKAESHTFVVIVNDVSHLPAHIFAQLPGVQKVLAASARCPLAATVQSAGITFANGAHLAEGRMPLVMAGPCSVEGQDSLVDLAVQVKSAGASLLRGGAFKPRTNPYDFAGLGQAALEHLAEARRLTSLPIVSEVMSAEQVEIAEAYVDVYQIGARNMYNYELLKEVGRSNKPVLLKRALSATIKELLQAAEYILLEGNAQVILCERGIRTFETHTRNTLDLSAVAALKTMTQLPVVVDPSHGTGKRNLIRSMSRAAIACGADGLLIEVHQNPAQSISDAEQAITPGELAEIVKDTQIIHFALADRSCQPPDATTPASLQRLAVSAAHI